MDNTIEEKAIEGFIEYLVDTRFVRGEADLVEFRLYATKAVLAHSDLFVDAPPEQIQLYVKYADFPVELRRKALMKAKAIEGFTELLSDIRFVCGKADVAENRLYAETFIIIAYPGLFVDASPDEIQSYVNYANSPVEQRRELLGELLMCAVPQIMDIALRVVFRGLSDIVSGGTTLAELEHLLKQLFPLLPPELCDTFLKKAREELGLNEVLKLEPRSLDLLPGSIAGADIRLNRVLYQRSVRQNESITNYEQDLAIALLEISEGENLDELIKMFGIPHDPAELIAMVREKARSACLRVLRKTIGYLPDIHQEVRKLETQGRELPLTEEVLATVPSKYDGLVEPSPADLLEHIGISRENTSEAEWQEFMMLSQKVLDGELEVGSKTGLSISAALGKDASRVRKTISRYRERQLNR